MDIFNIIAGTCSIIGLGISLFTMSKVVKITKSFNNNQGEIISGKGVQKIAKDHSVIAEGHSKVQYTDNRIYGEIDEKPLLVEDTYPIFVKNNDRYRQGVSEDTCELMTSENSGNFCFNLNFVDIVSDSEANRWIGYSMKSLPMNDWRSFVEESYRLCFQYKSVGTINEFWIEITNFQLGKKVYKEKVKLTKEKNQFVLELEQFKNTLVDWKSIDEVCFVFFPENCIGTFGTVFISGFEICK